MRGRARDAMRLAECVIIGQSEGRVKSPVGPSARVGKDRGSPLLRRLHSLGMICGNLQEVNVGDMQERLKEAVRNAAVDGRLSCDKAHMLGKELGVRLQEIGAVCNELKIKIKDCQLGCF